MIVTKMEGIPAIVNMFDGIRRELPKVADKDLWNVTQMFAGELRKAKEMAQIGDFTGRLSAKLGEKPMKTGEYTYGIPLPEYAYMLNRMRGHFAPIGGGRLKTWLDMHSTPGARPSKPTHGAPGYVHGKLYVMAHPFIDMAYDRVRQRLTPELENGAIIRTIRGKGK